MYLRHAIFRRFGGGRVPDARHVVVLETLPRPSSQCHLKVPTVSSSLRDDRRVGRPGRGTQCMDRVRTPSSTAAPARTPVGSQDRETGQSRRVVGARSPTARARASAQDLTRSSRHKTYASTSANAALTRVVHQMSCRLRPTAADPPCLLG